MSQSHPFSSFKQVKMDPKYRVSIQPSWRPEAGEMLYMQYSTRHEMPLLKVLSREAFVEKLDRVRNSDKTPAEKDDLLGRLAMVCREATINDQGKLLVPKEVSERAEIFADDDLVLVGRNSYFEIWNKPNFDRMLEIESKPQGPDDLGLF